MKVFHCALRSSGVRLVSLLIVVLYAIPGCLGSGQEPTRAPAEGPLEMPTSNPADPLAIVELVGANVTWNGSGSVAWDLEVPANMSSLAFAWWHAPDALGGQEIVGMLTMDGCPDYPRAGQSGGAVARRWCENPRPGWHRAEYTLHAGILHGRVCILGIPKGNQSLDGCAYSPY